MVEELCEKFGPDLWGSEDPKRDRDVITYRIEILNLNLVTVSK